MFAKQHTQVKKETHQEPRDSLACPELNQNVQTISMMRDYIFISFSHSYMLLKKSFAALNLFLCTKSQCRFSSEFELLSVHEQFIQYRLLVLLHGMLPELLIRENSSSKSDAL